MQWIVADRVLAGVITDHTYEATCITILKTLEEATAPLHIIINDSALTKTSLLPLNMLHTARIARHPNLGKIICIGPIDHPAPFFDRVIVRAYRLTLHRVNNTSEAIEKLRHIDDNLNSSLDDNILAQM